MRIVREQKKIDDLLDKCAEMFDEGGSKFPGMTYEQGLSAMYSWLVGEADDDIYE